MKAGLEPPLRAEEEAVLRALVTIIETTRRDWRLAPDRRPAPGATVGIAYAAQARSGPESSASWPYPTSE